MATISICIPVSDDGEETIADLERSLDSLVVQRYLDYEIVLTDASAGEGIERLVGLYDFGGRLRYFRNAHAPGLALNLDEALRLSHAPLVKPLMAGARMVDASGLGGLVQMMNEAPEAMLGCCASRDQAGTLQPAPDATEQARIARLPEYLLIEDSIGALSRVVYRHSALLELDPRLSQLGGTDLYIRALRCAPRLAASAEPLVILPPDDPVEDRSVRLAEAMLIFEKMAARVQDDPAFKSFFWTLLQQAGMRNLKQLQRMAGMSPAITIYFRDLYAHPPRDRTQGLLGRLRRLMAS